MTDTACAGCRGWCHSERRANGKELCTSESERKPPNPGGLLSRCEGERMKKRFFDKVVKAESGCWLWTGGNTGNGYGGFHARGSTRRAHRISWELHRGPIPRGKQVLHTCDCRLCVNPAHLYIGTNLDNIRDKVERGRTTAGRVMGRPRVYAKLTPDDVRCIRSSSATCGTLADALGVHPNTILDAKNRVTWKYIDG